MTATLQTLSAFERFIGGAPAAAVYFCSPGCGVCSVLEPKIEALLRARFPRVPLARVDVAEAVPVAAQQRVFTVPTLLVYFDGKEAVRLSRAFSPAQLADHLQRPYDLLFGDGNP